MTPEVLRQNKWIRRGIWAICGLLALWALAWLLVPPLVKSQVQKVASAQVGRAVTVGAVSFSPWTLELTINDLAVAGQGAGPPQLAIRRIYMDAELQSLLRLAPVVDAVTVDGVSARLRHLGGGEYDIDDILARIARLPPAEPGAEPARFALYNLSLAGGSFDFTDDAVGKTHEVRDLRLSLPFLSNLSTHRQVKVEPRLALKLNGSNFDSVAAGTPFADSRKTDATLKLAAFDLRPWLGYIPASVPVRLNAAVLDADLRLAFEQKPRLAVKLSGMVKASGVSMADRQGQPLLGFDALRLDLQDVRPLEREAVLAAIELTGPRLDVSRDSTGRLNLAALQPSPPPAAAGGEPRSPPAAPWKLSLAQASVRGGTVTWSDASTSPKAGLVLRDLSLDATGLALPFTQPMPFSGSAALDGKQPALLAFSGAATDVAASATLTVKALPLSAAAPYLAQQINPALSGDLAGDFGLVWRAAAEAGKPQDLQLAIHRLVLERLALGGGRVPPAQGMAPPGQGRMPLASIQKVELTQGLVDLGRQAVNIGRLTLAQPQLGVVREADGRWMYETWLKPATGGAAGSSPASPAAPKPGDRAVPAWAVTLGEFALTGGSVVFQDKAGIRPVNVELSALQVQARNFSPGGKVASPLSVSARVRSGQTDPGKLDFKGTAGMNPVIAEGQLDAVDIPLHAFEPYFGDALNIELLRADASFKGRVRYAQMAGGPSLKVTGDTSLDDFRANSVQLQGGAAAPGLQAAEELLNWRALSLRGLDVTVAPGAATLVEVRETTLSDFFARIIINETGRINLQDVVKASVPAGTTSTMAATASATVTAAAPPAASSAASRAAPTAAGASSSPPPVISFGPVNLAGGRVLFSDRFVKPNYSANLTELNGKLSAFSSVSPQGTPQLADLELRGRAEGTASLEVLGKLNPLAKPLALDIKGKVRDLELPPLSPYSIKYAGHGIERGKLSLDVAYLVKPDGQLTASNRLILNQLNFGEPVAGAPASLPVKLAVALLADRNGMIDIDLPISGSLNDPQFSLAPVIFRIIVNIIGKALTAPFSLLAGAFGGGGDELSIVSFSPGTAVLEPDAQKGLDKVAKALMDRPALKMTVVGTASLEVEREALKRERLRQLVAGEKRRDAVRAGATATGVVTVSAAEYPALLKEAYRRADIKKPRNVIGMAKDIPQAEMEELLLANMAVTDESMRELAVQRGVAVRDYLASQKLPLDRLYLGAAKSVPPEAKWSPRAEMNLAAQ